MWPAVTLFALAGLFLVLAIVFLFVKSGDQDHELSVIISLVLMVVFTSIAVLALCNVVIGNPTQLLDQDVVYELVWQQNVDGKQLAVLVEMEDILELKSGDRAIKLFRLKQEVPTEHRYFRAVGDGDATHLEPFELPQ